MSVVHSNEGDTRCFPPHHLASRACRADHRRRVACPRTDPVVRVRGTIAALDGASLSVITREGDGENHLPDTLEPVAYKRVGLDAVTPNSSSARWQHLPLTAIWQATYVLIFPEALRGTGEGHYDWDLAPAPHDNATVLVSLQANAGTAVAGL